MILPVMNRRAVFAVALLPLSAALVLPLLRTQEPTPPAAAVAPQPPPPLFTEDERKAVRDYWAAPGRYAMEPAPGVPPRVNITVAGSTWYWAATRAITAKRNPAVPPPNGVLPTVAAGDGADAGAAEETAAWEAWINRKVAFEKALAQGGGALLPDPGAMPAGLLAAVGKPPALYETVKPNRYTVTFAPEDAATPFVYEDALDFTRPKPYYGYYRSANGVRRFGRRVKDYTGEERQRLESVSRKAGRTDFERRVIAGVSAHEGGFEAINTYDTGFVSIGFIQFITARDGNGSLARVLLSHKADDPEDFRKTFRRFGIDATPDGVIVAVDPATGEEKRGADAVKVIIDDKRLTAAFERAGALDGFRLAQIKTAYAGYWPGDDPVTVTRFCLLEQKGTEVEPTVVLSRLDPVDGLPEVQAALAALPEKQKADPTYRCWVEPRPVSCKVSDVVKSEAGMATLMDRKVNRGNLRGIEQAAAKLMRERNLQKVEDLAAWEKDLIAAMKYRGDFLSDPTLSQPK